MANTIIMDPVSTGPAEIKQTQAKVIDPRKAIGGNPSYFGSELDPQQAVVDAENIIRQSTAMPERGSLRGFNEAPRTQSVVEQTDSSFMGTVASSASETGLSWIANTAQAAPGIFGEAFQFLGDIAAGRMESYTNNPQVQSSPDTSGQPQPENDKLFQIRHFINSLSKKPETDQKVVQVGDQLVGTEQLLEVVGLSTSFKGVNTNATGEVRIDLQVAYENNTKDTAETVRAQKDAKLSQALGQTGVAGLDGKMVFEGASVLSSTASSG